MLPSSGGMSGSLSILPLTNQRQAVVNSSTRNEFKHSGKMSEIKHSKTVA